MAKVTAPLFSGAASGKFGTLINFATNGINTIAKRPIINKPIPSAYQTAQRARISDMAAAWRGLAPATKDLWNAAGAPFAISGYTHFWRRWFVLNIFPPDLPTP